MSALSISSISRTGRGGRGEGFPQLPPFDVIADVVNPLVAELPVTKPCDGVIFVQALDGAGGRLDVPFDQRGAERLCDLVSKNSLPGPGLAFDQKRPAKLDGGIDRDLEVVGRDVVGCAFEAHDVRLSAGALRGKQLEVLASSSACFEQVEQGAMLEQQLLSAEGHRAFARGSVRAVRNRLRDRSIVRKSAWRTLHAAAFGGPVQYRADLPPILDQCRGRTKCAAAPLRTRQGLDRTALRDQSRFGCRCAGSRRDRANCRGKPDKE